MQILTWNLWWRFGPWEQRQAAIAETLAEVDADVALLQEVWWDEVDGDQLDRIAPAGRYRARSRRAPDGGDTDGEPYRFGNAVLSRWPIIEERTITLPRRDGSPSPRNAVVAEIDAPTGPLIVVCTHLEWRYDESLTRQAQLGVVIDHCDRLLRDRPTERPLGWPLILGGDLNAVPEADEVRRLTGLAPVYRPGWVFTDAWAAVRYDPGYTWTRDNPHSADAQWPRRRLDHVLVAWPRDKPRGNPLVAALVGHEPRAGVVPSDHYGVLVELDDREPFDHQN